jgi:hypothetical protein
VGLESGKLIQKEDTLAQSNVWSAAQYNLEGKTEKFWAALNDCRAWTNCQDYVPPFETPDEVHGGFLRSIIDLISSFSILGARCRRKSTWRQRNGVLVTGEMLSHASMLVVKLSKVHYSLYLLYQSESFEHAGHSNPF